MTRLVQRKEIAATESAKLWSGCAFSPAERVAIPKRKQKTTICRTSPRAMASKMLVGIAFRIASEKPTASATGTASTGRVRFAPGWKTRPATQPRSRAMVVNASKTSRDFQPRRPRFPRLPAPPMAPIRTPKRSGAMMARMSRRKMSLTMRALFENSGARKPRATPAAAAMSIHCARLIRRRIARRAGGEGRTGVEGIGADMRPKRTEVFTSIMDPAARRSGRFFGRGNEGKAVPRAKRFPGSAECRRRDPAPPGAGGRFAPERTWRAGVLQRAAAPRFRNR